MVLGFLKRSPKCGTCRRRGAIDFGGVYRCETCIESNRKEKPEGLYFHAGSSFFGAEHAPEPASGPSSDQPVLPEVSIEELEEMLRQARQVKTSESVTLQMCDGCGAQVEIPKAIATSSCLFCGREASSGEPTSSSPSIDRGVVPFAIEHTEAVSLMKKHLRGLWFRKIGVSRKINLKSVRKVYVPFWTFDTTASTKWSGHTEEWQDSRGIVSLWSLGNYKKTPVGGQRKLYHNDWLVCASHGVPPEIQGELDSFHTEGIRKSLLCEQTLDVPVERAAIEPRQAWSRAQVEIRKREYRASLVEARERNRVPEERVSISGRVQFTEPKGKSVLLPLYVFTAGKAQIVVNGKTGKVGSLVSYSWLKMIPLVGFLLSLLVLFSIISGGVVTVLVVAMLGYDFWKDRKRKKRDERTFLEG